MVLDEQLAEELRVLYQTMGWQRHVECRANLGVFMAEDIMKRHKLDLNTFELYYQNLCNEYEGRPIVNYSQIRYNM